jgi:hypothetical protein
MFSLIADTNLGGFEPPTEAYSANSATTGSNAALNLERFISNAIGALTVLGGLFFIFYFVMGGLNWVTAGGEQSKVTKARDQMIQGVVGMVVIVISYGLLGLVGGFVGFNFLNPGQAIIDLRP